MAKEKEKSNIIVGRNPVTEALKSGRDIDKLMISTEDGSMKKILALAKERRIPIMKVEKSALDRLAPGQAHQGVCAYVSAYAYAEALAADYYGKLSFQIGFVIFLTSHITGGYPDSSFLEFLYCLCDVSHLNTRHILDCTC